MGIRQLHIWKINLDKILRHNRPNYEVELATVIRLAHLSTAQGL